MMSPWLRAQLAYDRVRKVYRQEGLTSDQVEARLDFVCKQIIGKAFKYLQSDDEFASHLERAVCGNLP